MQRVQTGVKLGAACAPETGGRGSVVHSYLVVSQLLQAAVLCVQLLQTLVNWLSERLQDTLTQSSLYDALCRNTNASGEMRYFF